MKGMPALDRENKKTEWYLPSYFPTADDPEKGFIFLDEVNSGVPMVMAAMYQLALDGCIEDHKLKDGWRVIMAGNRVSDRGVVYRMPMPLANRILHLDVRPDINAWIAWALENRIDPRIISFLRFMPTMLYQIPPASDDTRGYPTPRTWEMASVILQELSDELSGNEYTTYTFSNLEIALAGEVGFGVMSDLFTHIKLHDQLPDPEAILSGMSTRPLQKGEPALQFAMSTSLMARLIIDLTPDRANRFIDYCITNFSKEFCVKVFQDLWDVPSICDFFSENAGIDSKLLSHVKDIVNVKWSK
jgi:hypothetical protein